jgi:hypothetical protein
MISNGSWRYYKLKRLTPADFGEKSCSIWQMSNLQISLVKEIEYRIRSSLTRKPQIELDLRKFLGPSYSFRERRDLGGVGWEVKFLLLLFCVYKLTHFRPIFNRDLVLN